LLFSVVFGTNVAQQMGLLPFSNFQFFVASDSGFRQGVGGQFQLLIVSNLAIDEWNEFFFTSISLHKF